MEKIFWQITEHRRTKGIKKGNKEISEVEVEELTIEDVKKRAIKT